jgi:hypothetical protein
MAHLLLKNAVEKCDVDARATHRPEETYLSLNMERLLRVFSLMTATSSIIPWDCLWSSHTHTHITRLQSPQKQSGECVNTAHMHKSKIFHLGNRCVHVCNPIHKPEKKSAIIVHTAFVLCLGEYFVIVIARIPITTCAL